MFQTLKLNPIILATAPMPIPLTLDFGASSHFSPQPFITPTSLSEHLPELLLSCGPPPQLENLEHLVLTPPLNVNDVNYYSYLRFFGSLLQERG